jgi:hypothetical protein
MVVEGAGVHHLDGIGHLPVEGHPPGGGEVAVDALAHQGVGEAVAGVARFDKEVGVGRLLQSGEEIDVVEAVLQHLHLELRADDGRHPQGLVGRLR